jgi:hypothetical protein
MGDLVCQPPSMPFLARKPNAGCRGGAPRRLLEHLSVGHYRIWRRAFLGGGRQRRGIGRNDQSRVLPLVSTSLPAAGRNFGCSVSPLRQGDATLQRRWTA